MATIAIVLAASLIFGGIILTLVFGYQEAERKREMQAKALEAEAIQQAAGAVPGFFARPKAAHSPGMIVFNDALASRLEHDIKEEQAIVAQFVHHPSLDTLYQHPTATGLMH